MPTEIPRWLRPSGLPRLSLCPASGVESEPYPDAIGPAAALGSAWHEIARQRIQRAPYDLEAIARLHGVSEETLRGWDEGLSWMPTVDCEAERPVVLPLPALRPPIEIGGTADVVLRDPAEIVDWKTGSPDLYSPSQWWQLRAYGVAYGLEIGAAEIQLSLCYVQLGDRGWRHETCRVAEMHAEIQTLIAEAMHQRSLPLEERRYRVDDCCTYCPARPGCPARTQDLRSFLALEAIDPKRGGLIDVENLEQVYTRAAEIDRKIAQITRATQAAKAACMELVQQAGGSFLCEDGSELWVVEVAGKAVAYERKPYRYLRRSR